MGRILTDPRFDPEDWSRVRDDLLDEQQRLTDDPAAVATEALWHGLWPAHPWRLPNLGTPASIRSASGSKLAALHRRVMAADNLVVAVVGGIDRDEVLRTIEAWATDLPDTAAQPEPPRARDRTDRRRTRRTATSRATVLVGTRAVGLDHQDAMALTLARHLLDSQAGRLFLELREASGLAYSVWAEFLAGIGAGTFWAGVSTDPARASQAATQLTRCLLRLATDGPDRDELDRTRRLVAGLAAMGQQRVLGRASRVASAVRFDRPWGLEALRQRLEATGADDVRGALQRLDLDAALTVTVRPG